MAGMGYGVLTVIARIGRLDFAAFACVSGFLE
jgi:hypothetical protein